MHCSIAEGLRPQVGRVRRRVRARGCRSPSCAGFPSSSSSSTSPLVTSRARPSPGVCAWLSPVVSAMPGPRPAGKVSARMGRGPHRDFDCGGGGAAAGQARRTRARSTCRSPSCSSVRPACPWRPAVPPRLARFLSVARLRGAWRPARREAASGAPRHGAAGWRDSCRGGAGTDAAATPDARRRRRRDFNGCWGGHRPKAG